MAAPPPGGQPAPGTAFHAAAPVRYETTLATSTTITRWVNGHQHHYTLTHGTLAAEALDNL
ncbi:hypothetical protein ABZ930_31015 [Streptomyces sp. NPDC046716]|uniref:hypothetical protein n=1 Tax=Streptomyces sp. NPDC046716 TaxID=3157093 RepID=UPI0033E95F39